MKWLFTLFLFCMAHALAAQQQSYDLFTFTPPKGWEQTEGENIISLTGINQKTRTWARASLVKSTTSKGSIDADFVSEWEQFAVKNHGIDPTPLGVDTQVFNGWQVRTGLGKFLHGKDTVAMLLNTFSNGQRCISFIVQSNTTAFGPVLDEFIGSIKLPPANPAGSKEAATLVNIENTAPAGDGFQFGTTNFEDGWTSVAREDWVEARKGNIRVLLHYPRAEDSKYYSQYSEHVQVFWNLLVAPRYTNLRAYQSPTHLLSFQPGRFAAGLLTEKETGKDVWVALFSKEKSGWIEVITPDKQTFVDNFGVDNPQLYFDEWDRLLNLSGLNRFAVGEKDLLGKWSNEFSNSTSYYSVYTGLYAGSTSFASRVNFTFGAGKSYKWDLSMAQGATAAGMKVDNAKAAGTWKLLNNWQIWFSEIERKPKTYNAYFSCIKGGRVLWLQDTEYGSYSAYGRVSN